MVARGRSWKSSGGSEEEIDRQLPAPPVQKAHQAACNLGRADLRAEEGGDGRQKEGHAGEVACACREDPWTCPTRRESRSRIKALGPILDDMFSGARRSPPGRHKRARMRLPTTSHCSSWPSVSRCGWSRRSSSGICSSAGIPRRISDGHCKKRSDASLYPTFLNPHVDLHSQGISPRPKVHVD